MTAKASSDVEYGFSTVSMIEREGKPRIRGLTYVRDMGMGLHSLEDLIAGCGEYIDILKFAGFGPRLQRRSFLEAKVQMCHEADIEVALGGAILENAVLEGPGVVDSFLKDAVDMGVSVVETCRQVVVLSRAHLINLIRAAKDAGLKPLAEIGVAYGITEEEEVFVHSGRLVRNMQACLEAGAWKVLLESEGITESRKKEDYRWDVVSDVASAIDMDDVMFEADDAEVWTRYISDYGPEVNLFVDASRVIQMEAARRGGWAQPQTLIKRVGTYYGGRVQ